jgi:hypothetical protein
VLDAKFRARLIALLQKTKDSKQRAQIAEEMALDAHKTALAHLYEIDKDIHELELILNEK